MSQSVCKVFLLSVVLLAEGVLSCDKTENVNQGDDVSIECPSSVYINNALRNPETGFPPNYSYDVSSMTLMLAATCEQDGDIVKWHVSAQTDQTTCVHVAGCETPSSGPTSSAGSTTAVSSTKGHVTNGVKNTSQTWSSMLLALFVVRKICQTITI